MGVGQTSHVLDTLHVQVKAVCMQFWPLPLTQSNLFGAAWSYRHPVKLVHGLNFTIRTCYGPMSGCSSVRINTILSTPSHSVKPLWCCTCIVNSVIQVSLLKYDEPF